ncbi:lysoplasmalogenase [Abyssalbus ytuae]|uniref:Lysoplasmalogenase n=1 Tax=Abyssalbus ytuae TaxID=2926907 RepID=A0A9E6ZWD8_9FLAO|nr:lysoplasmalogenase [Abyssalbus ytuae]UOB18031.1 lysoplasmalogenase [Abyssalbus ytuae]
MKYWKVFSVLFFFNLCIDILLSNIEHLYYYRYITKPLITISLLLVFYFNSKLKPKKERLSVIIALVFLLIGDIYIIGYHHIFQLWIAMIFFLAANILYAAVFYRSAHFNIDRSIPFIATATITSLTLLYFIYDRLNSFFIPATLYMMVILNMSQAAYLRNKVVNDQSYYAIFLGSLFFLASQSAVAIVKFYSNFPFQQIIIMSCYGLSQYLIIYGLLIEKKKFRRFQKRFN